MKWLILFSVGVLSWTLLEYLIHRFLGHKESRKGIIKKEHSKHHQEAHYFAPLSGKLVLAAIVFLASWLIFFLLFGPIGGWSFAAGLAFMYAMYEITHRRFHVKDPLLGYGLRMRKHHFYHHFRNPKVNHGVTTALWDRIFGTYQPVDKVPVPGSMKMVWLSDRNGKLKEAYRHHFIVGRERNKKYSD